MVLALAGDSTMTSVLDINKQRNEAGFTDEDARVSTVGLLDSDVCPPEA